jgi:cyclically-permuted mutarotase family protein
MKNLLMSTIISCMGYTNDMSNDVPPQLQWSVLHSLPVANGHTKQAGLAGPIVGVSQNVLMIAGGANFEDALPWEGGKKKYFDDIYVLHKNTNKALFWHSQTFRLPQKMAYTTTVQSAQGLICIGGEDQEGYRKEVFILKWNPKEEQPAIESLPDLPQGISNASATMVHDSDIYLAGGETKTGVSNQLLKLDLRHISLGWQLVTELPVSLSHALLFNLNHQLYLVGGRQRQANGISDFYDSCYSFDSNKKAWTEQKSLPYAISAGTGVAMGKHQCMLFGGDKGETFHQVEILLAQIAQEYDPEKKAKLIAQKNHLQVNHPGFSREILLFDSQKNTWKKLGKIPFAVPVTTTAIIWDNQVIIPSGEIKAGVRSVEILVGEIK